MLSIIMAIENEQDRLFVETLYDEYSKKMYIIANNILENKEDSEDVVHETIIIVIEYIDKFKDAHSKKYLKKLISIVCRNAAYRRYNQRSRDNKNVYSTTVEEDGVYKVLDLEDAESNIEKIVINKETCKKLKMLIDELDIKYKDVLALRVMGFDTSDIAKILGISKELVRQRVHRARMVLLKKGGDELYGK